MAHRPGRCQRGSHSRRVSSRPLSVITSYILPRYSLTRGVAVTLFGVSCLLASVGGGHAGMARIEYACGKGSGGCGTPCNPEGVLHHICLPVVDGSLMLAIVVPQARPTIEEMDAGYYAVLGEQDFSSRTRSAVLAKVGCLSCPKRCYPRHSKNTHSDIVIISTSQARRNT